MPDPWNLPATPNQKFGDLVHQKLIERKRVLDYSMFIDPQPTEADIEDLIPLHLYSDAFNAAYVRELGGKTLNVTELDKHPRAVERINHWLRAKNISLLRDGSFNHYRVAQALLPYLTAESLGEAGLTPFANLFAKINSALT